MKDLSIEEKAKRYDEICEKARKEYSIHEANNAIGIMDALERVFPELQESEDERIRKRLLEHFRKQAEMYNTLLTAKEYSELQSWIAWLEKQGSEPNWCHHKVDLSNYSEEYRKAYYDGWNNCNMQHSQCRLELDDVVKCLINGMKFYSDGNEEATWGTDKWSMPVKHIIEVLEKQADQKPADKVEPKFKVGDTITDPTDNTFTFHINAIKDGKYMESDKDWVLIKEADTDYELVEQKLTWGEKDAKLWLHDDDIFLDAAKMIVGDSPRRSYGGVHKKEIVPWLFSLKERLKSLKDRIQPQPKQEWSEEDA